MQDVMPKISLNDLTWRPNRDLGRSRHIFYSAFTIISHTYPVKFRLIKIAVVLHIEARILLCDIYDIKVVLKLSIYASSG